MPKKKPVPEPVEPDFDVECINQARLTRNRQWEYNIKWGGYSEEENSWEPEFHLTGCKRMVKEFWEQVGSDNKARVKLFPVGHTVFPSALWIKHKRESYRKSAEKKKTWEDAMDETDNQSENSALQSAPPDDDSGEDNIPLSQKFAARQIPSITDGVVTFGLDGQKISSKRRRSEESDIDESHVPPTKSQKRSQVSFSASDEGRDHDSYCPSSPEGSLFALGSDSDDAAPTPKSSTAQAVTSSSRPTQPQSVTSNPTQPQPVTSISRPSLSLDPARPKEKSLPAHLQRKLNPRVKSIAFPPTASGSLGGISTKARIFAQGTAPGPPMAGLNNSQFFSGSASPIAVNSLDPLYPSVSTPASRTGARSTNLHLEADEWLRTNIKPQEELTHNTVKKAQLVSVEAFPSTSNVQQGLHFSKRWRWSGELAVGDNESDDVLAEPIGGVVITDSCSVVPSAVPIGIDLLMPTNGDTLCLRHQFPLAALHSVLSDFKVSQFARMTADRSGEENYVDDLILYMTKHQLFSHSPLYIEDREVATMFVFPAALQYLWDQLGVPPKARQHDGLIVAVGFQAYVTPKRALGGFMETYHPDLVMNPKLDAAFETQPNDCIRAILCLSFPEYLFKRLPQKEVVIFTTPTRAGLSGLDTLALETIVSHSPGCKLVPTIAGSARFIFIHVSAWKILHKLPGLVDRRLRRADIQFYTFGSDPVVERKRWGVREVFPIGGIVTFTPRAIAEDPDGVEALIAKLDEHPLWACYILPSVVAKVVDVANSDRGPNSRLKSAVDAVSSILIPIEKGQIALTWQPPPRLAWSREVATHTYSNPKWIDWMIDQSHLSELRGHDLVLECQNRLSRFQNRSEADVEMQMVIDLLVMQSELREEYRRFVIITDTSVLCNTSREAAASRSLSKVNIKDGFEFTHVKDFVFGDDYDFVGQNV